MAPSPPLDTAPLPMPARLLLCLTLALAWMAPAAHATATDAEEYTLPGRGTLVLEVPVAWQAVYVLPTPTSSPTIHFTPVDGNAFRLTVSVHWYEGLDRDITRPDYLRELVQKVGEESLKMVPGQTLEVRKMEGAEQGGYLFSLVDAAAPADEYPYLTQGALALGKVVLAFTLLTRDSPSSAGEAALAMLRTARLRAPGKGV